jgi:hypothetical protein
MKAAAIPPRSGLGEATDGDQNQILTMSVKAWPMRGAAMFDPATQDNGHHRRRFGLTEVLLVAAILAFSAFTLVNDGRETLGTLMSGFQDVIGG